MKYKQWAWGTLLLGLSSSACVTRSTYDAKAAEVDQVRAELDQERQRAVARDGEKAALQDRIDKAQSALRAFERANAQWTREAELQSTRSAELSRALEDRRATLNALERQLADQRELLAEFEALGAAFGAATPEELRRALASLQRRVQDTENALKLAALELEREKRISQKLQSLIDAGMLRVRRRAGRLVIELPGDVHFASGSAKLTPIGQSTLQQLAPVLQSEQDRLFVVEGHTDNVPVQYSGFRNNWHLGSTRAESSRDALVAAGLDTDRVAIASWATLLPACPEVDEAECRKRNRRVEVVLLPRFE